MILEKQLTRRKQQKIWKLRIAVEFNAKRMKERAYDLGCKLFLVVL